MVLSGQVIAMQRKPSLGAGGVPGAKASRPYSQPEQRQVHSALTQAKILDKT